jgi:hypothetical protein
MKNLIPFLAAILLSFNVFSQSCLPEGIEITSQAQIDSFQADYPGCTSVEGTVEINGDDISNLNGLSVLTTIGESLYISNNDILTDISGLSSLTHVTGALLISTNPLLTSFSGLENLSSVEGDVFISNNVILNDISAIGNIDAANVQELRITGNVELATCDIPFICNYLADPTGKVTIHNNAPGCENPTEIATACGISMPCLPFGDYYFYSQAEIDAFPTIYPGCTDLMGLVHIDGDDISNLAALSQVHSIGGTLEIHYNNLLTSLAGLDGLVSVGAAVSIAGNPLLTDISALSNLDTSSITYLVINGNTLLSECDITAFCDYLNGTFGAAHNSIQNNNDGCKSRAEILAECTVGVKEIIPAEHAQLSIYPNPASDVLFIESAEGVERVSVYDSRGGQVVGWAGDQVVGWAGGQVKMDISVSGLAPGLYLIRVETGKEVVNRKIIVKN